MESLCLGTTMIINCWQIYVHRKSDLFHHQSLTQKYELWKDLLTALQDLQVLTPLRQP